MNRWKTWMLGLALAVALARTAAAQAPPVPTGPPPAVPGAPGYPGDPGYPKPTGFIGNICTTWDYMKGKLCQSPMGQMMSNGALPFGVLTGGMISPCCPPGAVVPAELMMPADSALGAAARVKADEAQAAARRAAVRYLGTVDCRYWPEAQEALINALRADRNECVRWEAAMALGSGCCCNPATMDALSISLSGSGEDGNPPEVSSRVRAAAEMSLARCVARVPPAPLMDPMLVPVPGPVLEEKPEQPKGDKENLRELPYPRPNSEPQSGGNGVKTASFSQRAGAGDMNQALARARTALARNKQAANPDVLRSSRDGLFGLARASMASWSSPSDVTPAGPAPGTPPPSEASAAEPPLVPPAAADLTGRRP